MGKTALIIDDNEIDRYIAKTVLQKQVFIDEVVCVESATDGLEYLIRNSASGTLPPVVILLDINMPDMNGFEFLQEYDKLPDSIKAQCNVIMLTTSLTQKDREQADANRYIGSFLNKPLTRHNIEHLVA